MDYLAQKWEAVQDGDQWKVQLAAEVREPLKAAAANGDQDARQAQVPFAGVAFTHPQHDALVQRIVELHNAALETEPKP